MRAGGRGRAGSTPARESIDVTGARRLALFRAGLWPGRGGGLPRSAGRGEGAQRRACHAVVGRFGYLQLDTITVTGARSHAMVLHSRLDGLEMAVAEDLLKPGAPLFEYWGHAASWIPLDLYPAFEFRRLAFRRHPWWGDVVGRHEALAREILARVRADGPLRSLDVEDERREGMWNHGPARQVLSALWFAGELAVRERIGFQRVYDLAERVIPAALREAPLAKGDALAVLLDRALDGHGWATERTLAQTFQLRGRAPVRDALRRLADEGRVLPCDLVGEDGVRTAGWVRPADLETATRLRRAAPSTERAVLLSPFDPVLWDRERALALFGFRQVLEIYVPPAKRVYGYYCLPVLAGDRLVGRVDLKAHRREGCLRVVRRHLEDAARTGVPARAAGAAAAKAVERFARGVDLEVEG